MYLESYNGDAKTTLKSNIDFAIIGGYSSSFYEERTSVELIMCSLCDIGINVRGVVSNFNYIARDKYIYLRQYGDIHDIKPVMDINRIDRKQGKKWQYKICKNQEFTHGVIYNKEKIKKCIIDYTGENKYKVITKYINDKLQIPITETILKLIDDGTIYKELEIWSKEPTNIKAYKIDESSIQNIINKLKETSLPFKNKDTARWLSIKTVNDYILEFNKEIKEKLENNINTRFNPIKDLPNLNMFKYNMKPYKGQVALIEAGKRTLHDKKNVIYTCDMGTGKSLIGTMTNDLYMQEKSKNKYITLVVAPNSTLKKWSKEIKNILGKTVNIKICTSTIDFIRYYNNYKDKKPLYILTSKETAKLGYKRKPAVNYSTKIVKSEYEDEFGRKRFKKIKIKDLALCPKCGMPMVNNAKKKKDSVENGYLREKNFKTIKKSNYKCPNCGEILWSAFYKKNAKTSLVDYCKKKKIIFDSLIWDEFHSERNISSGTGVTFGNILKMSKVKILLSGTMNNGNVSSIYPLFMRLIPRKMFKDGYSMNDMDKFIQKYGSLKAVKTIKDDEQRNTSRTIFRDSDYSEIAGINPIVFTKYLSDITITATMDDLGIDMVDYKEYPVAIDMENELNMNYNYFANNLKREIPFNFAMYENTIIRHYINNPFDWKEIKIKSKDSNKVVSIPNMNKSLLLNKEKKLIDLVQNKLKENKKCLVFTDFTGGHSKYQNGEVLNNRLCRILKEQNIKTKTLKANIKPIERMDYINKYPDTEVWITNPILVKEGLDLIEYPVIIFYNFDYEPLKIQQASRRAWRSIQTVNCETYYFYTKNTIEEKIMKSITLKKMEMNALEGKFNIDDFNLAKRTASALGRELYDCISVDDSLNKLNQNQTRAKNIILRPEVEKFYK